MNIVKLGLGLYWATPFKILIPPVEDFGKVNHWGSVNFQMQLPFV